MTIWIKKVRERSNEVELKVKDLSGIDEVNEAFFKEIV